MNLIEREELLKIISSKAISDEEKCNQITEFIETFNRKAVTISPTHGLGPLTDAWNSVVRYKQGTMLDRSLFTNVVEITSEIRRHTPLEILNDQIFFDMTKNLVNHVMEINKAEIGTDIRFDLERHSLRFEMKMVIFTQKEFRHAIECIIRNMPDDVMFKIKTSK